MVTSRAANRLFAQEAETFAESSTPTVSESPAISPQIQQQLKAIGVAQVIVVLKPTVATRSVATRLSAAARVSAAASAATIGGLEKYFQSSELSQRSALAKAGLSMRAGASVTARTSVAAAPMQIFPNLGVVLGTVSREGLDGLAHDDRVASVTGAPAFSLIWPNRVGPARLSRQTTWGLDLLSIPTLWKQGLSGKGIRVAHLDTGVDGRHPALKKAIAAFAQMDDYGVRIQPDPVPFDSDEHGTHTAGTIAGRAVQGKYIGVAPGAELCSAMVIEGGDAVARVLGGIDWALDQDIRVLSMSLGFRGWLEDFIPIVQILRKRNVLPVMAVGNEGPGTSRSPGNYAEVLSVGAIDDKKQVADFSSSQRFLRNEDPVVPDLVAPGVNIISARPSNRYQSMDGTSMATPHVAGLAALLFEAAPKATIDQVEDAIFKSCHANGIPPDRGNHGIPDPVLAFKQLTGIDPVVPASSKRVSEKKQPTTRSRSGKKKGKG